MIARLRKSWIFIFSVLILILSGILIFIVSYTLNYRTYYPPNGKKINSNNIKNNQLVSYWKFDDLKERVTYDYSGNENHAILKSYLGFGFLYGYPSLIEGKDDNALEFNGTSWVSGMNLNQYNINRFSVSVWVWMDDDQTNDVPTIMAKGNWSTLDGWWLCTKPGTRFVDMGIAWGESFKHIESGFELPLKEWHHIAVVMDNVDNEIQFYIDGLPYGQKHTGVNKWLINWNHDLYIGDYDGTGRWPWVGRLDEVMFFNRKLTDIEVYEIYNGNTELYVQNK